MRLDIYLFQNNYAKSRQKAKTLVEGGNVKVNSKIIAKPAYEIDPSLDYTIEITNDCIYVSRGGLKLEAILAYTGINVENKTCIDIGASTGGFTDCLLKNGAKLVYAVDSGTNQLDTSLKTNDKVVSIENYNARNIDISITNNLVDIITIDVSFISQTLIMPNALKLLKDDGVYISLIKPQFEVGRANIGKGGIVKDKKSVFLAVNNIISCAKLSSFACTSLIKSPILGGDGNTEYLAVFSKNNKEIDQNEVKKLILNWWGQKWNQKDRKRFSRLFLVRL